MGPLVTDNPDNLLGIVALQFTGFFIVSLDLPKTLSKEKELNDVFHRAPNSPFYAVAAKYTGLAHRWRGNFKKCSQILEPLLPKLRSSALPVSYLDCSVFCGLAVGKEGLYQKAIRMLQEGREFGGTQSCCTRLLTNPSTILSDHDGSGTAF